MHKSVPHAKENLPVMNLELEILIDYLGFQAERERETEINPSAGKTQNMTALC